MNCLTMSNNCFNPVKGIILATLFHCKRNILENITSLCTVLFLSARDGYAKLMPEIRSRTVQMTKVD